MVTISPDSLRRYPHFSGVDDESLSRIAEISEERSFRDGDIVFAKAAPASHLYVIVRGEVDLQSERSSGERKTVDTLVGGDLMCWSAVVEPYRTHLTGVARSDTRAIAIEATKLRELMEEKPLLAYRVMHAVASALSHRLEGAQIQLATRARSS